MGLNRRELMAGITALGVGLFAGPGFAFRSAQAQSIPALRYGVYPDLTPFVLSSKDWTGKYGVKTDFSWFGGGGDVDNAMVAGQVDIDSPGIGRVVSLSSAKPGKVAQLMVLAYGDYSAALVAPNSPYKTMADLKGKKIGTAIGSGAYMAWLVYLGANGFKPQDFQIVNLSGGSIPAALASGSIDGAVIWEPFPALMEEQKTGRIIQLFAKWVSDVALVQTMNTTLETRRGDVEKLLAGVLDCQEFIRSNPKEASSIISKGMTARGLTVPPTAFERIIKDRLKWEPDLKNIEDSLKKISDVAMKLGTIRQAPVFNLRQDVLDDAKKLRKA